MSRRRAARSPRAATPSPPSPARLATTSRPPKVAQNNHAPKTIILRADEDSGQSTAEFRSIQAAQAEKIRKNLEDPANARGDPEKTTQAVLRLLDFHTSR